ncbi:MAG TPA: two pore domain potassium channel family protein [Euryarchaeota archaeon]|nr:two pore domain potassium channel family protein [Euryarchaeota archaeon]
MKVAKLLKSIRPRTEIQVSIMALTFLIALGTVVYRWLEGWSWVTCFYFSVSTLTTVGYGDFYPTTELSRLFTAFYVLAGVTVALTTIGLVGADYLKRRDERLSRIISKSR